MQVGSPSLILGQLLLKSIPGNFLWAPVMGPYILQQVLNYGAPGWHGVELR